MLYDSATKTVYNVDDMGRCGPPLRCLRPYSAEKVKITGTQDAVTKTIKVTGCGFGECGGREVGPCWFSVAPTGLS